MEMYDIVCGICNSHEWKKNGLDIICRGCGHILTDNEIQKLLKQVFETNTEGGKEDA